MQPAASTSASARGPQSQHKYSFNIGSIDSFDRKMEEAQEALGFDPNEYVPITYTNELSWSQELLRLLPTLLLIGGYVWFTRRQLGGGVIGGGGMGAGRGIFNVGKAQVGTVDKNAKDKIMFKVSQTYSRHTIGSGIMLSVKTMLELVCIAAVLAGNKMVKFHTPFQRNTALSHTRALTLYYSLACAY